MSTLSTADGSGNPIDNLQTNSQAFAHTPQSLLYAVTHVFLPDHPPLDRSYPHPLHIPWESDYTPENEHSLARAVCAAAHAYCTHICEHFEQAQWRRISKMLDNLQASVQSEHMDNAHAISQLRGMQAGGPLAGTLQTLGRVDSC